MDHIVELKLFLKYLHKRELKYRLFAGNSFPSSRLVATSNWYSLPLIVH